MIRKPYPTQGELRLLFDYQDGDLVSKTDVCRGRKKGDVVGTVAKDGYRYVTLNKGKFLHHRLVWIWHNGEVPLILDHINSNPSDNRIENLRELSHRENILRSKVKDLPPGVCFHKMTGRYQAQYSRNYLGLYDTPEQAHNAYLKGIQ